MSVPGTETPEDDASLALRVVRSVAGTDREAEAELCRRLGPRVRLYGLRHLRDEAQAADLMQQVLLTMIERLRAGALREPAMLGSFVFGICRMKVLDLKRGRARRERLLEIYADALVPARHPAENLDGERLAVCMERLPERERTVLLMTFYDDVPAEALAKELELTSANVRVIRHRALKRLRACMSGDCL